MLYRIKIPRCLDVVVELENTSEAIRYAKELNSIICKSDKIYIHILEKRNENIVEIKKNIISIQDYGGSTL